MNVIFSAFFKLQAVMIKHIIDLVYLMTIWKHIQESLKNKNLDFKEVHLLYIYIFPTVKGKIDCSTLYM